MHMQWEILWEAKQAKQNDVENRKHKNAKMREAALCQIKAHHPFRSDLDSQMQVRVQGKHSVPRTRALTGRPLRRRESHSVHVIRCTCRNANGTGVNPVFSVPAHVTQNWL